MVCLPARSGLKICETFDGVILVTSNGKNPGALPWEFSVRVRVRIPSYNDNIWARSPLYQFTGWYMLLVTHSSTVRPGNELRSRYLNEQDWRGRFVEGEHFFLLCCLSLDPLLNLIFTCEPHYTKYWTHNNSQQRHSSRSPVSLSATKD